MAGPPWPGVPVTPNRPWPCCTPRRGGWPRSRWPSTARTPPGGPWTGCPPMTPPGPCCWPGFASREGRLRAGVAALDGVPGRKQAKVLGTLSGELYLLEEGIPPVRAAARAARVAPARAGPGAAPGHRRAADHQRRLHRPHPADRAGPAAGRPGSARGDQGRFPGCPGPPRWPPGRPGQRRAVPPAAALPAAAAGRRRGQPGPRPGRPAGRAAPPGRAACGQQPPERPARAGLAGGLRPAGDLRSPRFLGGDLAVAARGRSRRSGRAGRGPPGPVATS